MTARPSVLIVDDSETDRFILSRMLKRAGFSFRILERRDGADAIKYFQSHEASAEDTEGYPPLVIFLDINMGAMDGFEFLNAFAQLRQHHTESLRSVVVMMFTSSSREDEQARALAYDFVAGFLMKDELSESVLQGLMLSLLGPQAIC